MRYSVEFSVKLTYRSKTDISRVHSDSNGNIKDHNSYKDNYRA